VVATALARHGYTVLPARDRVEALRVLEEHGGPIDLLLTDVVMPEMSGPELAERARRRRPALRVLYMSGYTADARLVRELLEAEAALIHKPFTMATLAGRIRQMLDSPPREWGR
jgi:CheY-like chemotaxis protein